MIILFQVVKNSRGEIVKMIDETGKMFVSPAYQKRKEKAYSTLQSVKSIDSHKTEKSAHSVKSVKSAKSVNSPQKLQKTPDRPVKIKTPRQHELRTAQGKGYFDHIFTLIFQ